MHRSLKRPSVAGRIRLIHLPVFVRMCIAKHLEVNAVHFKAFQWYEASDLGIFESVRPTQ